MCSRLPYPTVTRLDWGRALHSSFSHHHLSLLLTNTRQHLFPHSPHQQCSCSLHLTSLCSRLLCSPLVDSHQFIKNAPRNQPRHNQLSHPYFRPLTSKPPVDH